MGFLDSVVNYEQTIRNYGTAVTVGVFMGAAITTGTMFGAATYFFATRHVFGAVASQVNNQVKKLRPLLDGIVAGGGKARRHHQQSASPNNDTVAVHQTGSDGGRVTTVSLGDLYARIDSLEARVHELEMRGSGGGGGDGGGGGTDDGSNPDGNTSITTDAHTAVPKDGSGDTRANGDGQQQTTDVQAQLGNAAQHQEAQEAQDEADVQKALQEFDAAANAAGKTAQRWSLGVAAFMGSLLVFLATGRGSVQAPNDAGDAMSSPASRAKETQVVPGKQQGGGSWFSSSSSNE